MASQLYCAEGQSASDVHSIVRIGVGMGFGIGVGVGLGLGEGIGAGEYAWRFTIK